MRHIVTRFINKQRLFTVTVIVSALVHAAAFLSVRALALQNTKAYNSSELISTNMDVDIDIADIPDELNGGAKNPTTIEKSEWIEGTKKQGEDAKITDKDPNALSGDALDGDGFLFSRRGDSPPLLLLNFNLNDFFPLEAKMAKIRKKTVLVTVQVDASGKLINARLGSQPAGFGFDEAALKIVKLARIRPGYVKGQPVKMNHTVAFQFELD